MDCPLLNLYSHFPFYFYDSTSSYFSMAKGFKLRVVTNNIMTTEEREIITNKNLRSKSAGKADNQVATGLTSDLLRTWGDYFFHVTTAKLSYTVPS